MLQKNAVAKLLVGMNTAGVNSHNSFFLGFIHLDYPKRPTVDLLFVIRSILLNKTLSNID